MDKAYVLASKHFDRHLTYVACTRHRQILALFAHQGDFKNEEVLYQTLSRENARSMVVDYAQARGVEPSNSAEFNLNSHALSRHQLAKERLEIKALAAQLPEKTFSFARAFEQLKGKVQGIIKLNDERQMFCIGDKDEIKLVAMMQEFQTHIGKQVSIQLDKAGRILSCTVEPAKALIKNQANSISKHAIGTENSLRQVREVSLMDDLNLNH